MRGLHHTLWASRARRLNSRRGQGHHLAKGGRGIPEVSRKRSPLKLAGNLTYSRFGWHYCLLTYFDGNWLAGLSSGLVPVVRSCFSSVAD